MIYHKIPLYPKFCRKFPENNKSTILTALKRQTHAHFTVHKQQEHEVSKFTKVLVKIFGHKAPPEQSEDNEVELYKLISV